MSDENKGSEGSNANGEHQKADVNEVLKRIEQLESTNKRLLDESKSWKNQATDFKSKLDENEKNKVTQSGDDKALLEYEKKQREKVETENKKLKSKTLELNIRTIASKYARDVHVLEDVLNHKSFRDKVKNGIDPESLAIDEDAVKDGVNLVLSENPHYKKNSQQAGVDSSRPKTSAITGADLENVKKGEHKEILKAALSKW
jgi:hypothetical protein